MISKNIDTEPLVAPICGSAAFWSLNSLRSGNIPPESVLSAIDYVRRESLVDIAQGTLGGDDGRHKYAEASKEEILELNDFLAKALQQIGSAV